MPDKWEFRAINQGPSCNSRYSVRLDTIKVGEMK
jgi:hypothetical protein